MKKIFMIALITGMLANSITLQAGTTAKKVGASAKIVCGILGLPASAYLVLRGITLDTKRFLGETQHSDNKMSHFYNNLLGGISILPLSIIAIQSGINDLRNIQNEGITV